MNDQWVDLFADVWKELRARGFKLPLHFAAIGVNGSVFAGTFTADEARDGLECEIRAQHDEGGGLALPLNMMYVDSEGHAARITVLRDGRTRCSPN